MGVKAASDQLHELVDPDVEVEQLGTGFTFTEGPIWNASEKFLLFSDMPGDTRRRWDEQNGVQVVASPSNKGNGMTLDTGGRLIVCEHSTSSVVRMDPDGAGGGREVLASHYEGKELNSPNDVVIHSDGSIYFSDPTYGRMPGFGVERDQDLDFQGVYRIPPGGGDVQLLVDDFVQPNGLCFSPDEKTLYLVDCGSAPRRIHAYEVVGDGTSLGKGRVLIDAGKGTPDGFRCDTDGNLWCGWGMGDDALDGVMIFSPQGQPIGRIALPERCANLCFGGRYRNRLFMAASQSLYALYVHARGVAGG